MQLSKLFLVAFPFFGFLANEAFAVDPNADSLQNVLIGATPDLQASANYGAGVKIADIDTGITQKWTGFSSAVNGLDINNINKASAVCLNGNCSSGAFPADQNGHGTFTASEIVGAIPNVGLSGVSPKSSLIAVQVMNAQGSGSASDIASGINYAVNHGAQVLNLSLQPNGTATQQAAFYESIASSVNYAASKGAVVVFAGGNNAQNFSGGLNITGFTNAALSHMLFTGSTNASEQLSAFSNTPGTAGFTSTSGQFVAYSNMWVMADGENITGGSNYCTKQYGCSYITQMSGTSMAAPQATGAAALLINKWPVLATNGTLTQLLEATATNLGANDTYGNGFLNLAAAFQPVGGLTAKTGNGSHVSIKSAGGAIQTGGALGSLSGLSSRLSNYTLFDSFDRNFAVNMSGLVSIKPQYSTIGQSVTHPVKVTTGGVQFTNGSSLSFGDAQSNTALLPNNNNTSGNHSWFMSYTDTAGSTVASGSGFPASASFNGALWGTDSFAANETTILNASNALTSLAEGGTFFAYGLPVSANTRFAASWVQTAQNDALMGSTAPNSNAISLGVTTDVTRNWKAGITLGVLNEYSGLLGATSYSGSPLSFGNNNHSTSVGVSSVFALTPDTDVIVDAAIARSNASNYSGSIIAGASPVLERSMGVALAERNAMQDNDTFSLSFDAPLRVYNGSVALASSTVDAFGDPVVTSQRVGITPNGTELDLTANYQAPAREGFQWGLSLEGSHDPQNIAGTSDITGLLTMKQYF